MKPLTACLLAVLALLAATATAQQFPFTEGPLEPSVNSNKVFFKLKEVADISGVWKGVNAVIFPIFGESWLSDGVTPFNLTCDAVKSFGWSYDLFITSPRATVIEADPENLEPGTIGRISHYGGALGPFPDDILDFETDGRMHHRNDSSYCSKLRPYLDWELGKTMMVQNRRNFYWEDENGATAMGGEECEFSGVIVDMIAYYECIAGPCLDLAHGLPGFVQTQGYVPVEPEETLIGSADEVAVDSTTGR